ncbi:MAG: 2TM domain-containing protein [Rhodospirillales bacterium]|nr:2TM domain-containing protein [Rhodospirillales bacterium]
MTDTEHEKTIRSSRRLKGFALHLLAYFVVMIILVPVNLFVFPDTVWFVLPLVGWGSVLAAHVAYILGLFGSGGPKQ